jgi:hypothetical protein
LLHIYWTKLSCFINKIKKAFRSQNDLSYHYIVTLALFNVVELVVLVPLHAPCGPVNEAEAVWDGSVHPWDVGGVALNTPGCYSNLKKTNLFVDVVGYINYSGRRLM